MKRLKTAYELSLERIIKTRYVKEEKNEVDFVKLDFVDDKIRIPKEMNQNEIPIKDPEITYYDDGYAEVFWSGNFLDYGGFAKMNRAMAFGLSNRGIRVKIGIDNYLDQVNEATKEVLKRLENVKISESSPKVFGSTMPLNFIHGGKKIIYTMIETSKSVHKDYCEKLKLFDEIWVPTRYLQKILKSSGITNRIEVMPLGVDVDRYQASDKKIFLGKEIKDFVFVSVFKWGFRKGYDILFKSYLEEFSAGDNVSLLVVSRPLNLVGENGNKRILDDFQGIRKSVNKKDEDLPHIAIYMHPIPEKDMPKLYNSSNAFILPSRGEGFGLPFIEAGACGLPIIASYCSGHTDFLTNENSFLVEPDDYATSILRQNGQMAKQSHFYEDQIFPEFGSNAISKFKEHMRYVFENYEKAKEKAKIFRKQIENNFTWEIAIDKVCKRIKEINKE